MDFLALAALTSIIAELIGLKETPDYQWWQFLLFTMFATMLELGAYITLGVKIDES